MSGFPQWLALGLTAAGAALEFTGIVLVADRSADLRRFARTRSEALKSRVRANEERLRPLIGHSSLFPVPGLGRLFPTSLGGRSGDESSHSLDPAPTGPVDEDAWRQAVWSRLGWLENRVSQIDRTLEERAREAAKDSWTGIALLAGGLLLALAGSTVALAT